MLKNYGKSGQFVFDEFRKLFGMIKKDLPDAYTYYMSIKPSPSRLKYITEMNLANQLIKDYLIGKPKSTYINLSDVILEKNSSLPDSSLFKPDYLHLNSKGYDKWQKVLEPYVR